MDIDAVTGSLLGLLTILLVVLKLMGEITLSWLWVFAPIWVPGVLSLGLEMAVLVAVGIFVYVMLSGGTLGEGLDIARGLWHELLGFF